MLVFWCLPCFLFCTSQSENARIGLCENQQWVPVVLLFGLVGCCIPPELKAELLLTLAAFGRTPDIAANLWQSLEVSQVKTDGWGIKEVTICIENMSISTSKYRCLKFCVQLEHFSTTSTQRECHVFELWDKTIIFRLSTVY